MIQEAKMKKHIINTDKAPAPVGPYSQGVVINNLLFISGQVALHPDDQNLVTGSFEDEVNQVFNNLEAICHSSSTSLDNAIKLNIYLRDLSNFNTVNEIMDARFSQPYPARATKEVSRLPKDANIEIDAIVNIEDT